MIIQHRYEWLLNTGTNDYSTQVRKKLRGIPGLDHQKISSFCSILMNLAKHSLYLKSFARLFSCILRKIFCTCVFIHRPQTNVVEYAKMKTLTGSKIFGMRYAIRPSELLLCMTNKDLLLFLVINYIIILFCFLFLRWLASLFTFFAFVRKKCG